MYEALSNKLAQTFSLLRGQEDLTDESIEVSLEEVRATLIEADVNLKVVHDLMDRLRTGILDAPKIQGVDPEKQFAAVFHHELVKLLGPDEALLEFAKQGPTIVLMVGLQGAGKTTTCAKLAKYLRDKNRRRPMLIAADVERPAAVEQLKLLGRQIHVPVFFKEGMAPRELCVQGIDYARQGGADLVILDTAGRLEADQRMLDEVRGIAQATKARNTMLVIDASAGPPAIALSKAFYDHIYLSGAILTKLDIGASEGVVLSYKAATGKPIMFMCTGEEMENIETFHPERTASRIVRM